MKTLFNLFPHAPRTGWKFGQVQRATEVGNVFEAKQEFAPIVSDGNKASFRNGATADGLAYDLLLYVHPNEMPTESLAELEASWMVEDPNGRRYNIVSAGTGMNQETGFIEHYELMVDVADAEDSDGGLN